MYWQRQGITKGRRECAGPSNDICGGGQDADAARERTLYCQANGDPKGDGNANQSIAEELHSQQQIRFEHAKPPSRLELARSVAVLLPR